MYESRTKARMRLHAGQLEDIPADTQCGCDVLKVTFARWGESKHFARIQRQKVFISDSVSRPTKAGEIFSFR